MMTEIEKLKLSTGITLAEALDAREVVKLESDPIGIVTVTLAGGDSFELAGRHNLDNDFTKAEAAGQLTSESLVELLCPEALRRHGGRLPAGVPFFRRSRIVGGRRQIEFVEAGR